MKSFRSSALLALLLAPASLLCAATPGPWSVRLAAAYLQTMDGSTNNAVHVDIEDKLIPEFDVAYAFNSHWSADLVLTIPQEHNVKVNGAQAGSFKHLPPTLLAKYTFNSLGHFTPYLGAGVNFTLIFDDNLLGGAAKLDNCSVGAAGQAGFDYKLSDHWALNADVKKMVLRTDVTVGGSKVTEARLDPWLYSLGLRYEF